MGSVPLPPIAVQPFIKVLKQILILLGIVPRKLLETSLKYGNLGLTGDVHIIDFLLIDNSGERTRAAGPAHLAHHAVEDNLWLVLPRSVITGSGVLEVGGGDMQGMLDVTANSVIVTDIDDNGRIGGAEFIKKVWSGGVGYGGHDSEVTTMAG